MTRHRSNRHALGATLRDFRERRGFSQEQLGYAAGLHRTYIGGVERGERNPSFDSIDRILRAVGMNWEVFGRVLEERAKQSRR